jgi:hypothetical protein
MEVAGLALKDAGCSFQSHAGVDVLAWQRTKVVRWIADAIKLSEDKIPYFDRLTVFELEVNFAARTADAVGTL